MKYILILFIVLISCDNPTDVEKKSPFTFKNDQFELTAGLQNTMRINLRDYIRTKSEDIESIEFEVIHSTEFESISIELNDYNLILRFTDRDFGEFSIEIQAANENYLTQSIFEFKINQNPTGLRLQEGREAYANKDYEKAAEIFETIVQENDLYYLEFAYLYLGYTQFKLESHLGAFNTLLTGMRFRKQLNEIEFLSGMAILNFIPLRRYTESIELCDVVLNTNQQFKLEFDEKINYKDLLLIKSMSQFQLGRYSDALKTLKKLRSTTLSSSDPDFFEKYAEIVNVLSLELMNN